MKISLIAAMDQNHIIGINNDLPWHLPDDFKYFKNKTKNHHVIMGRKNWESLSEKFRPLPNRTNIVISRNKNYSTPGALLVHSLDEALAIAKKAKEKEVFIIGGSEIYRLALDRASQIYLTEIHHAFDKGEIKFPEFNKNIWKETSRIFHPKDAHHLYAFDFVIYEKRQSVEINDES